MKLALTYHISPDGEGEYGCPGETCPGVKKLMTLLEAAALAGPSAETLVKSLRVAVEIGFKGSAEHGAFMRGTNTEVLPNPFLVLNQLEAALASGRASSEPPP